MVKRPHLSSRFNIWNIFNIGFNFAPSPQIFVKLILHILRKLTVSSRMFSVNVMFPFVYSLYMLNLFHIFHKDAQCKTFSKIFRNFGGLRGAPFQLVVKVKVNYWILKSNRNKLLYRSSLTQLIVCADSDYLRKELQI